MAITKEPEGDQKLVQIGNLIARLRDDRGITQSELGKMLGTTQSAVARIENGEQNLSTETLSKISRALKKEILNLSTGSLNLRIEGGRKLSGSIVTKSSKNSAMGLLSASLLNKNKTILRNMPKIEEAYRMIEVLQSIGVGIKWDGNDLEIKPPARFDIKKLDTEAGMKTRSVIMLIGPLVHFFKKFRLPQPGGCRLGSRTVKPHFYALEKMGVEIDTHSTYYEIKTEKVKPGNIVLYEAGDTVTENAIMAASLIPGKTTIKFASANYQVQDVCFFLEALGVKIDGIGSSTLVVHGVASIDKPIIYAVSEDPIESMFLLSAAIVTKSKIQVMRCPIDFLELELLKLEKMGFRYKILRRYKAENERTNLADIETYPSKLRALEDKIHAQPYPGINMDNLPFFAVIATQAEGQTFIHDWSYEKRAIYYKDLDKLGADTILADPHRCYINGPTKLKAAEVICPPALRPAAILLIGMLAAEGISILRNVYSINRGYEDLANRLNKIGANISILQSF
ncbi:MAG: UDP-N-acetylglucosamine 1-carboxyvinyltransferase [Candidatus Pacebacteria bacterium]|nr:UDP-N-acetylglucosamine 1-carboxyvinyltransferase [Candidatus Paceibacterota bacterium]MDD5357326.1 UDP-N-acetylglucosamine 1-carboxyvinyltransferase [Candidatus Paceibacterota bacterium]